MEMLLAAALRHYRRLLLLLATAMAVAVCAMCVSQPDGLLC